MKLGTPKLTKQECLLMLFINPVFLTNNKHAKNSRATTNNWLKSLTGTIRKSCRPPDSPSDFWLEQLPSNAQLSPTLPEDVAFSLWVVLFRAAWNRSRCHDTDRRSAFISWSNKTGWMFAMILGNQRMEIEGKPEILSLATVTYLIVGDTPIWQIHLTKLPQSQTKVPPLWHPNPWGCVAIFPCVNTGRVSTHCLD